MVNGIGFLIPSGIAAAGGLAQNYRGSEGDHYSSGLSLGFRMVCHLRVLRLWLVLTVGPLRSRSQ